MKYGKWINSKFIAEYEKNKLKKLNKEEIKDNFYKYLEFGTGGMRGIMGLGTNHMNIYMIRKATQGLSNYLINSSGELGKNKGVVIAYDCRINSYEFALNSALVLCANGIKTYLFSSLRSTPELSFRLFHSKYKRIIIFSLFKFSYLFSYIFKSCKSSEYF